MTENVSSLRSVKGATLPCDACASIPCGLAVRKQHKMLFAASKFEIIVLITLAHECAHQILFQLDADGRKIACHKRPEVRGNGSRVLRTQEDWNEWQVNTLGAAILMPQSEVDRAMWFINSRKPLTCYGWRFYDKDQVKIDTFCSVFGVSRSAAAIRLEQLGYLNRKKDYEYRDPLEVWP